MKISNTFIQKALRGAAYLAALSLLPAAVGCSGAFKLKDPPMGYAVVNEGNSYLRAKARDNVGLNIASFYNVEGGTLDYWGGELVEKLERRGYQLNKQKAVSSKNGVAGTRFDFRYTPAGDETEKFYTAILFVSDERRVVVQFAGDSSKASEHHSDADAIPELIKIRGCKVRTDVCDGPQPPSMTGGTAVASNEPGPAGEEADEPSTEPPATKTTEDADPGEPAKERGA
jgi:hypothetical protein